MNGGGAEAGPDRAGGIALGSVADPSKAALLERALWMGQRGTTGELSLGQLLLDRLAELLPTMISGALLWNDGDTVAVLATRGSALADEVVSQRIVHRALSSRSTIAFRSPRIGRNEPRHGMNIASPVLAGEQCAGALVLQLGDGSAA